MKKRFLCCLIAVIVCLTLPSCTDDVKETIENVILKIKPAHTDPANEKTEQTGETHEHVFAAYVYNSDASCTADGTKTAKCLYCDERNTVADTGTKTPHVFNVQDTDDLFLCTPATEKAKATYFYSCVCKSKGELTFEAGECLPSREDVLAGRYYPVSYIESTGTQYLDTGYSSSHGFSAVCDVTYTDSAGGYLVGSHNVNSPFGRNTGYYVGSRNTWELGYGESCPNVPNTMEVVNQRITLEFSTVSPNAYVKVNGDLIQSSQEIQKTSELNVLIFTNQYSMYYGSATTSARIYSIKMFDPDGVLIRDYVPVIDGDTSAAGLYDKVNEVFIQSETDPLQRGEILYHTFDTLTKERAADYKTDGYEIHRCSHCDAELTVIRERTSYKVTFVCPASAEISVYQGQDYQSEPVTATEAYSFNVDEGQYGKKDGQVNFAIRCADGVVLNGVTVSGDYKNLKIPKDGVYRITKIESDLTVIIELGIPISCSADSGFYDEPLSVSLASARGKIYYTLDGSEPDENAILYENPLYVEDASLNPNTNSMNTNTSGGFLEDLINQLGNNSNTYPYVVPGYQAPDTLIDKCTVLKAVAIDGDLKSPILTRSYFVGFDEKDSYENTGIISLTVEPDDFFGYENGIYVMGKTYDNTNIYASWWTPYYWWWSGNYTASGAESERVAYAEFFDEDGTPILSKTVGVRIHGNGSRGYVEKSLNLYARDEYDQQNYFDYDFFGNDYQPHKLTLLSGGDDYQYKLYDYLMSKHAEGMDYAMAKMTRYCLFLNGEFWGYYYLSEKLDDNYFEYYYGVDKDNLIVIKDGAVDEGNGSDINAYYEYLNYISYADLTVTENYEYLKSILDIDSFIDYYAMLGYIDRSGDWPGGNTSLWRSRTVKDGEYQDGKWRYVMFDINSGAYSNSQRDPVTYISSLQAFKNVYKNEEFKKKFDARLAEIATSVLTAEDVSAFVDNFGNETRTQMINEYNRFFGSENTKIQDFDAYLQRIKDFFAARETFILDRYGSGEHVHSYTPTVTKVASFTEKGERTYVCSCGDTYTEDIPSLVYADYAYEVTFVCDEGISIGVYNGQNYTSYETASVAYSADKKGNLLKDGEGQVNFAVLNESQNPYTITVEGSYKNIKGEEETGLADVFRVTKIKSNLTIRIQYN